MRLTALLVAVCLCNVLAISQGSHAKSPNDTVDAPVVKDAKGLIRVDEYTLKSPVHLVDGIDPIAGDHTIRVVVEIPTGSTQKWEVEKSSGNLEWEFRNGKPRVVKYLGYAGNYGMVPRTLLSEEHGGDGDPLDVLVLGPAVPRGSIIEVRIIGLLKMLDKGEHDDKLIAVLSNDSFNKVDTIKDLDEKFPGVTTIIETWFANYKGQKKITTHGYAGRKKANKVLAQALNDYKNKLNQPK